MILLPRRQVVVLTLSPADVVGHVTKGQDGHGGRLDDAARMAVPIGDDGEIARLGRPRVLRLVSEQAGGRGPLDAAQHQVQQGVGCPLVQLKVKALEVFGRCVCAASPAKRRASMRGSPHSRGMAPSQQQIRPGLVSPAPLNRAPGMPAKGSTPRASRHRRQRNGGGSGRPLPAAPADEMAYLPRSRAMPSAAATPRPYAGSALRQLPMCRILTSSEASPMARAVFSNNTCCCAGFISRNSRPGWV